jgi:hypothetical protein
MKARLALLVLALAATAACKKTTQAQLASAEGCDIPNLERELESARAELAAREAEARWGDRCMASPGAWDIEKQCCRANKVAAGIPACVDRPMSVADQHQRCDADSNSWDQNRACCRPMTQPVSAGVKECVDVDFVTAAKSCGQFGNLWDESEKCCRETTSKVEDPAVPLCIDVSGMKETCEGEQGNAWDADAKCCRPVVSLVTGGVRSCDELGLTGAATASLLTASAPLPPEAFGGRQGLFLDDGLDGRSNGTAIGYEEIFPRSDVDTSPSSTPAATGSGEPSGLGPSASSTGSNDSPNTIDPLRAKIDSLERRLAECRAAQTATAQGVKPTRGACVVSHPGELNSCAEDHTEETCKSYADSKLPLKTWTHAVKPGMTCADLAAAPGTNLPGSCTIKAKSTGDNWCYNFLKESECRNWAMESGPNFEYVAYRPGQGCNHFKDGTDAAAIGACEVRYKESGAAVDCANASKGGQVATPSGKQAFCDYLTALDCQGWCGRLQTAGVAGSWFNKGGRCPKGSKSTIDGRTWP